MSIELILLVTGIIGTIAFSISGALIGIENNMDIFGVIILGWATACFGGMLRDMMMNQSIVMFEDYIYSIISFATSIMVFIVMCIMRNLSWVDNHIYKSIINAIDSIGLGAFVVVGIQASYGVEGQNFFSVVFYGVLTAVGGGLLRDIMARKIPMIFRKHIYAVAAIIGALFYYMMHTLGFNDVASVLITVAIVAVIRYLAYHFELSLPRVKLKTN